MNAAVILASSASPDWRTKPLDHWTPADALAEARFRVASLQRQFDRQPDSRMIAIMLGWWEGELTALEGKTAGGRA